MKVFILILMVGIFFFPKVALALPKAKATVLVVDESANPIEGARVGLGFSEPKTEGWGIEYNRKVGQSNSDGQYVNSGNTEPYLPSSASHPDYYTSRDEIKFTGISGILGFRKWQPWNPTLKLVLRKKQTPIPMYAYYTDWLKLPKTGEYVGYDLTEHDWVAPHGTGVIADFIFKIDYHERTAWNDSHRIFNLKFANEFDGIQAFQIDKWSNSDFKSAYHAPTSDYRNGLNYDKDLYKTGKPQGSYYDLGESNYYFRVRCQDGDETRCLYGKIYGNIEFGVRKGIGIIKFKYYLNPTPGDTNIEFDPKQNLFKGLNQTHKP